jgi:hypothetical protein
MADLPKEVKCQVVKNMVSQGPYAFVSLKNGSPSLIWDDLRPMDWLLVFTSLANASGLSLPTSVTAKLREQASVLHNHQQAEEIGT